MNNYVKALETRRTFLASRWDKDYEYPLGDVNMDGIVNLSDINMIINAILPPDQTTQRTDVDGDGNVDASDVNIAISTILHNSGDK